MVKKHAGKLEPHWRDPIFMEGFGGTHGKSYRVGQWNGAKTSSALSWESLESLEEDGASLRMLEQDCVPVPQATDFGRRSELQMKKKRDGSGRGFFVVSRGRATWEWIGRRSV